MVNVTSTWLSENGRTITLPLSAQTRKELGAGRARQVSQVKLPKTRRTRRIAALIHTDRATVQEVTYSYSGGFWWVSVRLRVLPAHTRQYRKPTDVTYLGGQVGVDAAFGTTYAVLSVPVPGLTDEEGKIPAPRPLQQYAKALAQAQVWLERTNEGSKRHKYALLRVQRLHGRVAAERQRWLTVLARQLATIFDTVIMETLNLTALAKRKKGKVFSFGSSVHENAHGKFKKLVEINATRFGSKLVLAPWWFPSSKMCSDCLTVKTTLPLQTRTYKCEHCNMVLDRDVNAARNLAAYTTLFSHYTQAQFTTWKTTHTQNLTDIDGKGSPANNTQPKTDNTGESAEVAYKENKVTMSVDDGRVPRDPKTSPDIESHVSVVKQTRTMSGDVGEAAPIENTQSKDTTSVDNGQG